MQFKAQKNRGTKMLELRPNCELCDCDLPPDSKAAFICSYECTYCENCVDTVLCNVCPTCGGNFTPRPVRPRLSWRTEKQLGLEHHPASSIRLKSKFTHENIEAHVQRLKHISPEDR
jgi:uncharacterized protein